MCTHFIALAHIMLPPISGAAPRWFVFTAGVRRDPASESALRNVSPVNGGRSPGTDTLSRCRARHTTFLYFVSFLAYVVCKKKDGSFPDGLRLHDNRLAGRRAGG